MEEQFSINNSRTYLYDNFYNNQQDNLEAKVPWEEMSIEIGAIRRREKKKKLFIELFSIILEVEIWKAWMTSTAKVFSILLRDPNSNHT